MNTTSPLKIQRWGGAFQVEVISDPSVKQALFGWMSAQELGPQSAWRFAGPLDSKKMGVLKHARLLVAKRPGTARTGYLCFYPPLKVAIFVEDQERRPGNNQEAVRPPRCAILRMRHSPTVYNGGGAIFAATLCVSDSVLWIEDVLTWEGKNIWNTSPFSKRWSVLKSWFESDWSEDVILQRGLAIKPRNPEALETFKSDPGDVWEFIPEDAQRRRLFWKDRRLDKMELPQFPFKPKDRPKFMEIEEQKTKEIQERRKQNQEKRQKQNTIIQASNNPVEKVGVMDTYFPNLPQHNDGSLVAVAKKEPTGPDVYSLFSAENTPLGIAVIRKMMLSLAMRTHCVEKVHVKVEWNSSFDRWEIVDVNVARNPSPTSAFKKMP